MPRTPELVAIGHVTNDRLPDGSHVAGGSALYAALAAASLGARARIVTSHGPDFVGLELLRAAGVVVDNVRPAARTTCFENVYEAGVRRQRVHAIAEPLAGIATEADIAFFCPVIDEIDGGEGGTGADVAGVGLQGWLREVAPDGSVGKKLLDPHRVPPRDVVFCSVDDLSSEDELALLEGEDLVAVVTEGARGGRVSGLRLPDLTFRWRQFAAYPAREVDPTGAGDVFAASFLLAGALAPEVRPAVFAACAASIVVEGAGATVLPTRAEVAARVERYLRDIATSSQQG